MVDKLAGATDRLAASISRRRFLGRTGKAAVVAVGVTTMGMLNTRPAYANHCTCCNYAPPGLSCEKAINQNQLVDRCVCDPQIEQKSNVSNCRCAKPSPQHTHCRGASFASSINCDDCTSQSPIFVDNC